MDAQGAYLDVGKSKVVGVLNHSINVREIAVEFALGSGEHVFDYWDRSSGYHNWCIGWGWQRRVGRW